MTPQENAFLRDVREVMVKHHVKLDSEESGEEDQDGNYTVWSVPTFVGPEINLRIDEYIEL